MKIRLPTLLLALLLLAHPVSANGLGNDKVAWCYVAVSQRTEIN